MSLNRIDRSRWTRGWQWTAALAGVAALAACGGGGGDGGTAVGDGSLRVALTDAPSCYEHVNVTVQKISVNQSATAGDSDGGWTDLTLSPARRIDLVTLTNGVLEELGTVPLAAGHYSQIRLVLAGNTGAGSSAMANSVQPIGGAEMAMDTPSAMQSGLKLKANFDVAAGQMADLVLDFDACKSIVKAGNSGKYLLKPVVSVVPRIVSGLIGYVSTTLGSTTLASTNVAAQQDGNTIRSTVPDATGKFFIPYLAAGTYTLVVTSEGHATAVVTNVPTGTTTTVVNGTATAIAPPTSPMADITGALTASTGTGTATVSTPITDATVRALQALTGGPTIEVVTRPVDATLGTYSLHVPVGAPVKASFPTGTATLSFAPDTPVGGLYTIQAQAPGRTVVNKTTTVSTGTTTTSVNFNY